jgi:hypothetical protein
LTFQPTVRYVSSLLAVWLLLPLYGASGQAQGTVSSSPSRILSGEMRLTADTRITAQEIVLKDLLLITNGFQLVLEAAGDLEVRTSATIRAFDGAKDREPGRPGRSAGLIIIRAGRTIGPVLQIDNSGEDGAPGRPGSDGRPGPAGHKGAPRGFNPINGCINGSDGQQGAPGEKGGDGEPGGNGGNGGVVMLEIRGVARAIAAKTITRGGRGGAGGRAGRGGPGGQGGEGAYGTNYCGGTAPGQQGPQGPDGREGMPGQPGSDGQIFTVPVKSNLPPRAITKR